MTEYVNDLYCKKRGIYKAPLPGTSSSANPSLGLLNEKENLDKISKHPANLANEDLAATSNWDEVDLDNQQPQRQPPKILHVRQTAGPSGIMQQTLATDTTDLTSISYGETLHTK